jgi:hypothetical protein
MKPHLPLALLGAILFAGCDTGTQASTSSETQTALQELADNAGSIASRLPTPGNSTVVSARRMDNSTDSTWAVIDSAVCAGGESTSHYDVLGINIDWLGPGTGPDGTAGSCSLASSIHPFRQYSLDSLGRSDFHGTRILSDTLQVDLYVGDGTWDLRSGLSLTYLSLSAYTSPTLDTFHQVIQFGGNCQIEVRMRDTLVGSAMKNSGADAPVVCGGLNIGRFLWDQVGMPQVLDLEGRAVPPRPVSRRSFPEDSLGVSASILGIDSVSRPDTIAIRSVLRWRFLAWDSIAIPDSVWLLDGSLWPPLASAPLQVASPDTITMLLSRSAFLAGMDSLLLELPFRSDRGWATSPILEPMH